MAGTLYLVGTPIGNLGDLTDRARQTLAAVDLVAAEDTRRTGRLLSGLGIKARMLSFFAVVSALVVSGLPTDRFTFEGFFPKSGKARSERLEALSREPRTIVLFESPRRVTSTLGDLLAVCGDRRVAVVRELTKLHQEVIRGRLSEVLEQLGSKELKGEVVLVIEGGVSRPAGDEDEAVRLAASLVRDGARKREAARRVSELTGVPASRIYEGLVR